MHIGINGWFLGQLTSGSGQYLHHLLVHLAQQPGNREMSVLVPDGPGERFVDLQKRVAELDPRLTALVQFGVNTTADHSCSSSRVGLPKELPTYFCRDLLAGVKFIPVSVPRLPRQLAKLWWEQIAVPAAARRLGADVLWVPYWAAPLWQPIPVTVTVHDLIHLVLPEYRGGVLAQAYTALVSYTARRAAAVITVSHASARDIADHLHIPAERIHVVHSGPNAEMETVDDASVLQRARERYGLPSRYFLYLGGFDRRKNVETTLRAYRRYLEKGGDATVALVIAGKPPAQDSEFAPDPQRMAADLGLSRGVHFCGWIDEADKATIYAMAEAFLFPSLYEGFGMMVLEAMAAGTPVVSSER